MEKVLENIVIVNDQPDFELFANDDVSADFFVICENDGQSLYEQKIAGLKMVDYVARACKKRPKIFETEVGVDFFDVIRPYLSDEAYTVILFASTPLVMKSHINMILNYVAGTQMNACRLEKGFIFRTEYLKETSEIFSGDIYSVSSDEFFEVKSASDIEIVKDKLAERVLTYHRKNGVKFENGRTNYIDANSSIYFGSEIGSNSVIENSNLAGDVKIGRNCVVVNSKIEENVVVADGAKIYNCVIKNGTRLSENCLIKESVIGQGNEIDYNATLVKTGTNAGCLIECFVNLRNCRLGKNCRVLAGTEIYCDTENVKKFEDSSLVQNEEKKEGAEE